MQLVRDNQFIVQKLVDTGLNLTIFYLNRGVLYYALSILCKDSSINSQKVLQNVFLNINFRRFGYIFGIKKAEKSAFFIDSVES